MRDDEVKRGVLLVYKTRNSGWFNFRHSIFELQKMPKAAREEYGFLLRRLADEVNPPPLVEAFVRGGKEMKRNNQFRAGLLTGTAWFILATGMYEWIEEDREVSFGLLIIVILIGFFAWWEYRK